MNIKKLLITVISIISISILISSSLFIGVSYADPDDESEEQTTEIVDGNKLVYNGQNEATPSIQRDLFMGIFHKKITNGNLNPFVVDEESNRQKLNFEIYTEEADKTYSLYDRFGGNITFPLYLGEEVTTTGFIDKIYEYATKRVDDQEGFFGTISKIQSVGELLLKNDTIYTNEYYTGRPALKNSEGDPRVALYENNSGVTPIQDIQLGAANYFLDTAKTVTSLTSFMIDDGIVDTTKDVMTFVFESEGYEAIQIILRMVIGFLVLGLVIFLVRGTFKYVTAGGSLKAILVNFIGALFSVGLMVALVANPVSTVEISSKVLKFIDNISAEVFNVTYEEDEIVNSDNSDNVIEALLWEEAVFKPWVNGVFNGRNYDELYTTYADNVDEEKHLELPEDSALSIGDIAVPRGNGVYVKNWAALAYSCSTVYHIDSVDTGFKKDYNNVGTYKEWPKAEQPSSNKSIYVDDFRWIDASLGVGKHATDEKLDTDPYVGYEFYEFKGISAGLRAMFLAFLMLPLLVLGVKKFAHVILCLGNLFIILGRSCINLIKPDDSQYNVVSNIKSSFEPFIGYFFYSILIVLELTLYKNLAPSDNGLVVLFFVIISLYIMLVSPKTLGTHFDSAKRFYEDKKLELSSGIGTIKESKSRMEYIDSLPSSMDELNQRLEESNNGVDIGDYDVANLSEEYMKNKIKELRDKNKALFDSPTDPIDGSQYLDYNLQNQKGRNGKEYAALYYGMSQCKKNYQAYYLIATHRTKQGKLDADVELGIPKEAGILQELYSSPDKSYKYYDSSKANRAKARSQINRGNRSTIDNKRGTITNNYNAIVNGGEAYEKYKSKYLKSHVSQSNLDDKELQNRMLKSLRKEAKKNIRESRLENVRQVVSNISGSKSSVLSAKFKFYGLIAVIILWLIGLLLYVTIGV